MKGEAEGMIIFFLILVLMQVLLLWAASSLWLWISRQVPGFRELSGL